MTIDELRARLWALREKGFNKKNTRAAFRAVLDEAGEVLIASEEGVKLVRATRLAMNRAHVGGGWEP